MPRLKRLSGTQLIAIFAHFGFSIASQRGSHVKLRRFWQREKQTLTVPTHTELDPGTCRAIYRQACRYIDPAALKPFFFWD
jgi:predicted RNA binding protein YcfA (HicA-like mRNA interferase family)